MNIFGQIVNIFHRKKPAVVPAEKEVEEVPKTPTPPPAINVTENNKNKLNRVSSIQISPEQLEFEASRHLLDIDFLESDMNDLTFPSFEHLLVPPPPSDKVTIEEPKDSSKNKIVRHRLSLYRPLRSRVKRAKSTPNFVKQQQ